jgi:DNA-binding LacI/PurR family transcriptional regulator
VTTVSIGRDREKGYCEAMSAAGIDVRPEWVASGNEELPESENAAAKLLSAGVTAIFAANDVMAYAAMRAIRAAGKKVGDDVAVVGMDDIEMSSWMNPPLTTVRYDIQKLAEIATRYVIKKIQTNNLPNPAGDEMPVPELIVRSSCGAKR